MPRVIANRYSIGRRLGDGGFAEVHAATDLASPGSAEVAIKTLLPRAIADAPAAHRLRREIATELRLTHSNLMPVLDYGDDWYTMPVAERSLKQQVEKHGPVADVLEIFEPIAAAVGFLHEKQTVHRDLAPGNVLLVHGGWVVADCGLAASTDVTTSYATTQGQHHYGTRDFIAPEQRRDLTEATSHSDIYSLGKLLQYMIEAQWPEDDPEISNPLYQVISRATRNNPSGRFATVGDLLAATRRTLLAPRPSGSLADQTDELIAALRHARPRTGTGEQLIELARRLDPAVEREARHLRHLLAPTGQLVWSDAWRASIEGTREAVHRLRSAVTDWTDKYDYDDLDPLANGLLAVDFVAKDLEIRHDIVIAIAIASAAKCRYKPRNDLADLVARTPTHLIDTTVTALQESGEAPWVFSEYDLDDLPAPLRHRIAAIPGMPAT